MLNRIAIIPLFLLGISTQAELLDLTESELSELTGEGVGLVYESYQIEMLAEELNARDDGAGGVLAGGETGNKFQITGIKDIDGNTVTTSIAQFYFAGTGTNLGTDLTDKVVNIGRLNNPITIDLLDGNTIGNSTDGWADKSVLQIAMPTKVDSSIGYHCTDPSLGIGSGTCSSRSDTVVPGFHGERFDMGYRINRDFDEVTSGRDANLNFHAVSANMDGSYMRFWGGDADVDGDDISNSTIMLEAQINFYASELIFDSCDLDGSNCGEQVGFNNFSMELALGDAANYQPMTIDVTDDGFLNITIQAVPTPGDTRTGGGAIVSTGVETGSDATTWAWYKNYYENGRKTNISVSDMTVGAESFGSSSIQGLQIQYLEVISHEL